MGGNAAAGVRRRVRGGEDCGGGDVVSCAACEKRGKTWQGSDPTCAFGGGIWSADNWNCATDGLIRDLVYEGRALPEGVSYQYCDDMKYATVNVSEIELDDPAMALWVCWYKSRGATDAMLLLASDGTPRRPTEDDCLRIAAAYTRYTLTPLGAAILEGRKK